MVRNTLLTFVFLFACLSVLVQSALLNAQVLPSSVDSGNTGSHESIFLSGKVRLEDGSRVPGSVSVVIDCSGQNRTAAYADIDGDFGFQLNSRGISSLSNQGSVALPSDDVSGRQNMGWQVCDLRAEASGYVSARKSLSAIAGESGLVNLGTVVMYPLAGTDGFTISAADAEIPKQARKDFEKGQQEAKKGKWSAAREKFQKAVTLCPRFAMAWLELGRMQTQESNLVAARESFHAALEVDSKLPTAYIGLAQVAAEEGHWQELADTTDHLLALNPTDYPQFWFLNGVANFNLRQYDRAERSVLRSMQSDSQHRIPKNEYLLGLILAVKHDYREAAEHVRSFLQTSPDGKAAEDAHRQLTEFEKLAAPAEASSQAGGGGAK